jgi:hypothetical protein
LLQRAARHLTNGGVFLIEAFVPDSARFDSGQRIGALDVEIDQVQFEVSQHDPSTQSIRLAHVEVSESGIHLYPVQLRHAFLGELELMARLARMPTRYGGWNREPFAASSPSHASLYKLDPEKNLDKGEIIDPQTRRTEGKIRVLQSRDESRVPKRIEWNDAGSNVSMPKRPVENHLICAKTRHARCIKKISSVLDHTQAILPRE